MGFSPFLPLTQPAMCHKPRDYGSTPWFKLGRKSYLKEPTRHFLRISGVFLEKKWVFLEMVLWNGTLNHLFHQESTYQTRPMEAQKGMCFWRILPLHNSTFVHKMPPDLSGKREITLPEPGNRKSLGVTEGERVISLSLLWATNRTSFHLSEEEPRSVWEMLYLDWWLASIHWNVP